MTLPVIITIIIATLGISAVAICIVIAQGEQEVNEIKQIIAETRAATTMPTETVEREYITPVEPPHPLKQKRLAGTYKISHYTPDPRENGGSTTTATGRPLKDCIGWACAANKADFDIGTLLYVTGYGYMTVEDTGCRRGVIDVLVPDKETAYKLGVVSAEVYTVEAIQ